MRQAPSRIEYSEWTCRWMNSAANGRLILGVGQDASALGDVGWFAPARGAHVAARGRCRKGSFGRRNVVGSRRCAALTFRRLRRRKGGPGGGSSLRLVRHPARVGERGSLLFGLVSSPLVGRGPEQRGDVPLGQVAAVGEAVRGTPRQYRHRPLGDEA